MVRSVRAETILWVVDPTVTANAPEKSGHAGPKVLFAEGLPAALEILGKSAVEAIILRVPIAGYGAEELVKLVHGSANGALLIVYEPAGAYHLDDELVRLGASQYISDAVPANELLQLVSLAIRCRRESTSYQSPETADTGRETLVGSSGAMRQVIEIIRLVSPRRSTVLITGETGSGKEVAARAIHAGSTRSGLKMVAVNCAALPDHLLEAELFGHTKGAFTGAVNARVGLFEQANRSTIFLDEIGEMPLQLQVKLLRVLQEREIQRIGSSEPVPVDVRVIAASNTNLLEAVANRTFREDLYYRLNVVALRMPALRERILDVPELVDHFLVKIAKQENAQPKQLSPEATDVLMRYAWPGNVRQLEHALESAVALSGNRMLLYPADFDLPAEAESPVMARLSMLDVPETGINFEELIMGIERRLLERALVKSGGNKARAANMLQMKRTTLISKFKSLEVCA